MGDWHVYTLCLLLLPLLALSSSDMPSPPDGHPLVHSCAPDNLDRQLYVVTVNGGLTALDSHGSVLWQYCLSLPLFSSTLSYGEPTQNVPNLIPGLDRNLYHWDGQKLERLPVTADHLLEQAFPYSLGLALVGSKVKEVTGIDTRTGKPVYECSQFKCQRYDNQSHISAIDILTVNVQRTTVRQASEYTGEEQWNFTVGDVQLSLVEGEGEYSCAAHPPDWRVQVDTLSGTITAVSREPVDEPSVLWQTQLDSPITDVWVHVGGRLEKVTHHGRPSGRGRDPSLMIINYKNQYYIQPTAVAPPTYLLTAQPSYQPRPWKTHYWLSVPEEEKVENYGLTVYYDDDSFLKLCTPGPNGLAMYFYLEEMEDSGVCCLEENSSEEGGGVPSTPLTQPELEASRGDWMLGVGMSAVKYSLFGCFILGLNRLHHSYHDLRKRRRKRSGRSQSEEEEERRSVSSSSYSPLNPNSSAETLTALDSERDQRRRHDSVDSRFESDYELHGCLGKGGFGVVYHVKNRTDGGEYAIKRIKLPNKKWAREKVMREVHALARLDHPGIVRYFHSWVERAPVGWSEMEEWLPLSRRPSYVCSDQSPVSPSSRPKPPPSPSPCPSFSSLDHSNIHSELPPRLTSDSRNSSFTIEFRDDTQRPMEEGSEGCFSRDLLSGRDDLSISSASSGEDSENASLVETERVSELPTEPPTYVFIQMQLCQKDSLREWLRQNVHNRSRVTVMDFFEQVLDAVLYVHGKGMMHRDLKPSNIFFSQEGSVKVGDFGLVTGTAFRGFQNSYLALKSLADDHRHTGNIGTHLYMSPEQVSGAKYDQKVDIFSLGVIFFELHYPFSTEMERVKVLEDLRQQDLPQKFRARLPREAELVEWMMAPLASQRPSAEEVYHSGRLEALRSSLQNSDQVVPKL